MEKLKQYKYIILIILVILGFTFFIGMNIDQPR